MKINKGSKAFLFKKESFNCGLVDLEEILKNPDINKIVIIFSRYFGCPICMLDFINLIKIKDIIKQKKDYLIYITQSSKEVAEEIIKKYDIDFPIIGSSKEELYANYGLGKLSLSSIAVIPKKLIEAKKLGFEHGKTEGYEAQSPGQFVIDKNGVIIHMKKGWLDINSIISSL